MPFTEEMPAGGCTNPYGWTKFMIEQILRDAAVADPAMSVVLLLIVQIFSKAANRLLTDKD